MGQSATLYSLDRKTFVEISHNPKNINIVDLSADYIILEKTFDGHIFVLSKILNNDSTLISELIYPIDYLGEKVDLSKLDFDNLPDDFDFENGVICYNSPDKINKIDLVLSKIGIDDYTKSFDPDELNQADVYPSGVWNRETDDNYAYNARSMGEEFLQLKDFISRSKDNYIISMIG